MISFRGKGILLGSPAEYSLASDPWKDTEHSVGTAFFKHYTTMRILWTQPWPSVQANMIIHVSIIMFVQHIISSKSYIFKLVSIITHLGHKKLS